ncbi:MAG: aldolase/citrate lyase family protein [Elusimicrobiota bacterium]|jgi:2-dehydro-3-deoxyglucarate aldolase
MIPELRQRLRKRERLFGAWTSIGHPSITEIFTRAPFDFIGIDLEHSTISQEQSQRIIAACQARQIPCLPRVSSHNAEQIKRLLDSGADGMIVPMVNTVRQRDDLVRWMKYSPVGQRSFGVARAQGYGFDFDSYTRNWNKRSPFIIQIESIEAVEVIDQLLDCEHVDGVMTGPYDMSGSLGVPGQLDHPKVRAACQKVIEACRRHGLSCGTQIVDPDAANIRRAFAQGFTFLVLSSDVFLLWKWAERMGKLIPGSRRRKNRWP